MIPFAYHYRRRHLDNTTGISTRVGPVLAHRDDRELLVLDQAHAGQQFTEPVVGRRGTATTAFPRPAMAAWRLWLWPARPMRLIQHFDATGTCTLYRVDFTSFPWRSGHAVYQTDLFLD